MDTDDPAVQASVKLDILRELKSRRAYCPYEINIGDLASYLNEYPPAWFRDRVYELADEAPVSISQSGQLMICLEKSGDYQKAFDQLSEKAEWW